MFNRNPDFDENYQKSDANVIPDVDCGILEPEMIPAVRGEEVEKDSDKISNGFTTNSMNLRADI